MKKYYLLLLAFCFATVTFAQIDRSKAPASGPAPKVNIGEYQSFTLKNGLKVLVVENNKIPRINFMLEIVKDPLLEKDKAGYTQVAGELWGKATQKRNAKQLSEEVDFLGANLRTGSEYASISGLSRYKDQMMEILSDVVLHPSFPQDEFDKIILQTKSALKTGETNPGEIMNNIKNATLYGPNHPYGDIITEKTIDNITLEDCKNYYKTFIYPNHAILVIVGDITLKEAQTLTQKYLGEWKPGDIPSYQYEIPRQPQGREVVFSSKDAAPQASIQVTYPINYTIGAPDQIALNIMNQILGGGDFDAKLFKNLREDKGYTYGSYSSIRPSLLKGAGNFNAYAEVKANTADSAIVEILKEMKNMDTGNFSAEDLQRVKKTWAGEFSRSLENPSTIANFAYYIERYKLPKDYYSTFLQRLEKTNREEVISAAQKYIHPENAYILVVGDRSLKPRLAQLSTQGEVKELDSKGQPVKETPKVSADDSPAKVIQAYLKAIGGQEKLRQIKDMTIKADMKMQNMVLNNIQKFVITPEHPTFLMELAMGGNVMQKIIFDGEKGYISGAGGQQTLEGKEAESLKQQAYPILELEYETLGITPVLEGIENVNGRNAYKLKVTLGDAITYDFYDVENGLKLKSISINNGSSQEALYEDYRPTSFGLIYPFKTKTQMQGMPIEINITDLQINTGLSAADLK